MYTFGVGLLPFGFECVASRFLLLAVDVLEMDISGRCEPSSAMAAGVGKPVQNTKA